MIHMCYIICICVYLSLSIHTYIYIYNIYIHMSLSLYIYTHTTSSPSHVPVPSTSFVQAAWGMSLTRGLPCRRRACDSESVSLSLSLSLCIYGQYIHNTTYVMPCMAQFRTRLSRMRLYHNSIAIPFYCSFVHIPR